MYFLGNMKIDVLLINHPLTIRGRQPPLKLKHRPPKCSISYNAIPSLCSRGAYRAQRSRSPLNSKLGRAKNPPKEPTGAHVLPPQ